jgi:hypothetical protein
MPEGYFDLNGRNVGRETKGLLIRRTADGKTHKAFNK